MRFILLSIAVITLSTATNATELKGTVKSEAGKPLAGVQIRTDAPAGPANIAGVQVESSSKRYEVVTKADGTFSIPSHGEIIYFHRDDLRPLTKILKLTESFLEVTMEDGSRSLWNIPPCSAEEKAARVGIGFMVKLPEKVMTKKVDDQFQDGGYLFGYRVGGQVEVLINWWESTSVAPLEEDLLASPFSERMWKSGDKWGYEFRGTKPDGKIWRRVAIKNGAITYQGNGKEAAKVFDNMLDTMCFDASAVKW